MDISLHNTKLKIKYRDILSIFIAIRNKTGTFGDMFLLANGRGLLIFNVIKGMFMLFYCDYGNGAAFCSFLCSVFSLCWNFINDHFC
jgi:hypothetical protein